MTNHRDSSLRRALAIAFVLCGACSDSSAPGVSPEAEPGPRSRVTDRTASTRETRYIAVLVPFGATDIKAKESGDLISVKVRPGDRVSTGDLLAELDLTPVRESLAESRAQLRAARASLARSDVDVSAATSALKIEKDLFAQGIGARKNLEEAEFALERARKAREGAAANVQVMEAQVEKLVRRVGEARITSPIDGTVSQRYRDPGTAIIAGDLLLRIIRVDQLWVRFAVPSTDIDHIAVGDTVSVDIESTGERIGATVAHKAPELDPATQMFFVEGQLELPADMQTTSLAGLSAWVVPTRK